MKRWIWRALVFVLIGAAINVAVAWGCALWGRLDLGAGERVARDRWPARAPAGWPEPTWFKSYSGLGMRSETAHAGLEAIAATMRQDPNVTWHSMTVDRFGLPLGALQTTRANTQVMRTITPVRLGTIAEGLLLPKRLQPGGRERFLPLRPVWGGFAVNSVVFGGVEWVVVGVFRRRRGVAREKRGLCPVCGYPVGVASTCTECGRPVKPREVAGA